MAYSKTVSITPNYLPTFSSFQIDIYYFKLKSEYKKKLKQV